MPQSPTPKSCRMLGSLGPHVDTPTPPSAKRMKTALRHAERFDRARVGWVAVESVTGFTLATAGRLNSAAMVQKPRGPPE